MGPVFNVANFGIHWHFNLIEKKIKRERERKKGVYNQTLFSLACVINLWLNHVEREATQQRVFSRLRKSLFFEKTKNKKNKKKKNNKKNET